MSQPRPLPRDPRPHRRIRASVRAGLVWGTAAAAVNIVLWLFASAIGIPMEVVPGGSGPIVTIGALIVIGATLFASVLAGVATGLLGKAVRHVLRWLIIGAVIITAASLAAPWGQPDSIPTSTRIVLTMMHLVTAAVVLFGLCRGIWTDDRSVYS